MIKIGIIGSSGYVAGELIRLLINHPKAQIDFLFSHSKAGLKANEIHQDLLGTELVFTDKINPDVDLIFLCLGHGNSRKFLENNQFSSSTKIIDLSNDFRLDQNRMFLGSEFVYGLCENNEAEINKAKYIANPGCFATAIQLAILPLVSSSNHGNEFHIHGITGSTGAGSSFSETSHFSWRNNNLSLYKEFNHQHLNEIQETFMDLNPNFSAELNFIPVRGDFTRGILVSAYTETELSTGEIHDLYKSFYAQSKFVHMTDKQVHLKQVVNTNYCSLQVQKVNGKVLVTSVLDNLLKGAAGQAVQNMNLLFGIEETTGLKLKANYF